MKMFKLMGKRGFAVFTSLALCASLVAPGLAASFNDLQDAINGVYGGDAFDVRDDDEGVRTITLKEDVKQENSEGAIGFKNTDSTNIILDLNGSSIVGNGSTSVITVNKNVNLTIQDSSAHEDEETGEYVSGTITGGTANGSHGGGISITAGSTVTLDSGTISGNTAGKSGGGVSVQSGSTFIMNGGEISGNTAEGPSGSGGAGVHVMGGTFIMNDGTISDNESPNGANGTGVAVHQGGSFTMEGGTISGGGDPASNGTVHVHNSTLEMNDGAILGDVSITDWANTNANVTINGGTVSEINPSEGNSYTADGYGLQENEDGTYNVVEHSDDNHSFGSWVDNGDGTQTRTCQVWGCTATETEDIPEVEEPVVVPPVVEDPVVVIPDVDVPLAGAPTVEIDDVVVPLSGLITRADAVGYLWEQAGSPEAELSDFEDVPEDHEWAVAIGWAQANGIAVGDLDGNFRPDDLLLRSVEDIELAPEGELEQFLNRYAAMAIAALEEETEDEEPAIEPENAEPAAEPEADEPFIELEGDWDDIIMGEEAQIIFDDFFAQLELVLEPESELELEA